MKMVTLEGSLINVDDALISGFKDCIRCEVLSQGDSGYDKSRVRTITVDDVVKTVNFARDNNILLAVKGGGHSVAGKCLSPGGITIDLRLMNGVYVDPESRIARVGGGTLLGEMDKPTQAYGLATQGGIVSDTGVACLTLGAGFGWIRAKYGLSIDNLLSVNIVTSDGQYRHASESENEDLFGQFAEEAGILAS
jgi:FAD/FMN-containing dehydrogenase